MKSLVACLVAVFGLLGCVYAQNPTVNMVSTSDITFSSAKVTANLVDKGDWTVNGKGFVYSTDPVPTKANGTAKNVSGTNTGQYQTSLTGLAPSTTYYVRAYVKKGSGATADTVYSSNTLSFTTSDPNPPTFTTPVVTEIGLTGATFTGEITEKNDANIQPNKGFVYSTSPNPTYYDERAQVSGSASPLPYSMTKSVEGLLSGATYYVRSYAVVKYGSTFDTVYSSPITFQTQHACGNPPFGTTISDVGITEATISFSPALGQVQWEVDYGFAGHNAGEGTLAQTLDTTISVSGLEGGRSYSVFVRAVCGDLYSDWSDIRTFTTVAPPCAQVTGVHAREIGYSSAKIEWTPGSMSQTRWEVVFAKASDNLPAEGVVIEGEPIFSPIGLIPQSEYKLKVRALCGEFDSPWTAEFRFNTIQQGLENAEAETVKIYPNPTNGKILFEADHTKVRDVQITDAMGRLLFKSEKLPESFDFGTKQGVFFIHIETENGHQIEKIIVR